MQTSIDDVQKMFDKKVMDFVHSHEGVKIFDCDNVLSNDEWRIRTIRWDEPYPDARYAQYHLLAEFDEPANVELVTPTSFNVVFTAMPEWCRAIRQEWFEKHKIPVHLLYMRPDEDFRSSVAIKRQMLQHLQRMLCPKHSKILAAYDDRQDIIDMYKAEGVETAQLIKIHNNCAWTKPEN